VSPFLPETQGCFLSTSFGFEIVIEVPGILICPIVVLVFVSRFGNTCGSLWNANRMLERLVLRGSIDAERHLADVIAAV